MKRLSTQFAKKRIAVLVWHHYVQKQKIGLLARKEAKGSLRRIVGMEHEIRFGSEVVRAIATPGHTPGSMSFLWRDRVFTGDTLLIGGCGRADFQHGDAEALYHSITGRLFMLDDDTLVYPGHDYNGRVSSTIGEEKFHNERLNLSVSRLQFVEMMGRRNTPRPSKMDVALPANMKAGRI